MENINEREQIAYTDFKGFTAIHKYEVKLVELDPMSILNLLEPEAAEVIRKEKFYNNLEQSILDEGIRNPIMINAGYVEFPMNNKLDKSIRNDPTKILACCRYGGSRLYIAQKLKLPKISCLVSDYINRFSEAIIHTQPEVEVLFTPTIREIVVTPAGLWGKA